MKQRIIIVISILASATIIGLALTLVLRNTKLPINNISNKTNSKTTVSCTNGWQTYRHDVLGISFCYPTTWGKPVTQPLENLTRLSGMEETMKQQQIAYDNSLSINFDKNNLVTLTFFNDQYTGKNESGVNDHNIYFQSGSTDNVINLKTSGDICNYEIDYRDNNNPLWESNFGLSTIHSTCSQGVKTVLTQFSQAFAQPTGILYTYDLRLLAFKKVSNGYFNNILVSRRVDQANQIHEQLKSLDDFFGAKKTTDATKGLPTKTKMQLDKEQQEFTRFVSSISAFKPVAKAISTFQPIAGENQDITTIRKYYGLIVAGKLDDAYAMYADKAGTTLEQFKQRYQDTYKADPYGFKNTGPNQYEFHVKYQDQNSSPEEFHVIMQVHEQTVKTTFLEEYQSNEVTFGNISAYAARRGKTNHVFLKNNGKETSVDEGDANYDANYTNIGTVKFFSNPQFSPKGNYLIYEMSGWEWFSGNIYDILGNKKVAGTIATDLEGAHTYGFTEDEKHFYLCSSAGLASGAGGKIYSVPGFNVEYDALSDPRTANFLAVDCSYDKNSNLIVFQLSDYFENNTSSDKTLTVKYNLTTQQVEK